MKKLKLIIWSGIILFSWSGLSTQLTSQGTWKYYTTADGLAHDHVWCINQDRDGNYWFGTKKGVTKLDSNGVWISYLTEYVSKEFNDVWIMDIEFDSVNYKWITASGDFTAVNQSTGNYVIHFNDTTFTWYQPAAGILPEQKPVCVGKDSLGTIWVGMFDNYAWWFDGKSWHDFFVPGTLIYDGVHEIKTDRKKRLFFAHDNGLAMLDGFLLKSTGSPHGCAFFDIACDRQNHIWCASQNAGMHELVIDGKSWHWTVYDTQDGLLSHETWAVAVDSSNSVWIGTPFGAQRFDRKNWLTFTRENGLIHDHIWNILVDRGGDVWIASSGGVSVFHDTSHTTAVKLVSTTPTRMPDFRLQNYPNPFNAQTTISYFLPVPQTVKLMLYNLRSQLIMEYAESFQSAGPYEMDWDGRDQSGREASSGVYYVILQSAKFKISHKIVLIR